MQIRVDMDFFTLLSSIDNIATTARTVMTEQALHDTYPLVPYQTHALANSAMNHSDPEAGKMVWATPYARRRYFEGTPKHKETTTHWVEKAAEMYSDDWIAAAQKALGGK